MPMPTFTFNGPDDWAPIHDRLQQRVDPGSSVESTVREILADVQKRGNAALAEYTRKFDCESFTEDMVKVPEADIQAGLDQIPADDLEILREATNNIRVFHENQRQKSWLNTSEDGTVLGQLVRPVDRVGLYVPGGQGGMTPLISSLLMNAIPAQVAGVEEICVISPPTADGTLNPYILATAALLGITEVHRSGSAWAIAALAYGTETIKPCDVLAGPGNIFVATAKRLMVGQAGIDMIAGPSEIAILADDSANPAWLAADMLSQAEHDPLAAALLITPSEKLAEAVRAELKTQTAALPRGEIATKSLQEWGGAIIVPDMDTGLQAVNLLAPEHFELAVDDPWQYLGKVRHAGAIFMGHNCPEPVGDYFAGPNHVLPTLGGAKFSSALSVLDFCKSSSLIATSSDYVQKHGAKIARFARLEGLEAHARSVETRLKTQPSSKG